MEGSGSRDMANYYLGGRMPCPPTRQTDEQPVVTDSSDLLNLSPSTSNATNAGPGPGSLILSAEEQSHMMKSIQEIFGLEEEAPKEDDEMADDEDDDEVEEEVDLEDRARRTKRLKGVLSTLAQLWWSDSEQMDLAAEKLADGSRDRELRSFPWLCFEPAPSISYAARGSTL